MKEKRNISYKGTHKNRKLSSFEEALQERLGISSVFLRLI
jgi:hypothetical protein